MSSANWGPADEATLAKATAGLMFPTYPADSADLNAEIQAHNDRAGKLKQQLRGSLEGLEAAGSIVVENEDGTTATIPVVVGSATVLGLYSGALA